MKSFYSVIISGLQQQFIKTKCQYHQYKPENVVLKKYENFYVGKVRIRAATSS